MARARNIKPGFFTNDQLAELPALTRLFFAGLWTVCDRAGRVEDRPKKIKAEVMPYDDLDPDQVLEQLCKSGFIARYEAGGVRVIQVLTWDKHQNPHIKEAASTLPEKVKHGASTVQEQCDAQPLPERAGLIPDSGFLIPSTLIPDCSTDVESAGKPRKPAKPSIAKPDDVEEQTWADWLTLRKAKKAPVTETVVNGARSESVKAAMTLDAFLKVWCRRGSQGLEASWLNADERSTGRPSETPYQRSMRERMQEAAPEFARKDPSRTAENVVDFFAIEVPAKRLEIGNEPSAALG
jgi:hypothetical protein